MKTHVPSPQRSEGSVLMVTLATAVIIGIALASYLSLVRNQNSMVARSQAWNAALAAAEAGIEEAFANVNTGMPKLRASGPAWSAARNLSGGRYVVSYADYPSTGAPLFYATGYCTVPALSATLVRVVRVQTSASSLFGAALVALGTIDMTANKILTDSYNSTNGIYASSPHSTNGDVVSLNGLVNIGGADIHGDVLLGAGNTNSLQSITNALKNGGSVSGAIANDFNMDLPPAVLPADFNIYSYAPPSGGTNFPGYTYATTSSGDYTLSGLTSSLIVPSNTTVRLRITGDVKLNGSPGITIQKGGNLTIYMDGPTFSAHGNGSINNLGSPVNFNVIGLTNNTSIDLGGNADYVASIYAPNAALTLGGTADFSGAAVVKSATLNGNAAFHFDEALLKGAIIRGYVGGSWEEL